MESLRQNTAKIQFQKADAKPSDQEMMRFVLNNGLTAKDIHTLYQDLYERCIYVKFNTEQRYLQFIQETNVLSFNYLNGTVTKVTVKAASGIMKYVRVFNLPPEITDKTLSEAMLRFGSVLSTRREKFGAESLLPVFSGVRGVYVEIENEIPQFIYIQNIKARIFYDGMKERCYKCGEETHKKQECPQLYNTNNKIIQQQLQQQTLQTLQRDEQQVQTPKEAEHAQQSVSIDKNTVQPANTNEPVKYSDVTKTSILHAEAQNKIEKIKKMINVKEYNINKERKPETDSSCMDTENEEVSVNKRGRPTKKTRYTTTKNRNEFIEQYNATRVSTDVSNDHFITPTPPMKTNNNVQQ